MTFEQWWARHSIEEADIVPVLKLSFKELSKSAWNAALYNNPPEKINALLDRLPTGGMLQRLKYLWAVRWLRRGLFQVEKDEDKVVVLKEAIRRMENE